MVSLSDLATPSKAAKIKVADLKAELTEKGLEAEGLKSELIDRLKSHLEGIEEKEETEGTETKAEEAIGGNTEKEDTADPNDEPTEDDVPKQEVTDDGGEGDSPEGETTQDEKKDGEAQPMEKEENADTEEDTSKRPREDDSEDATSKVVKTNEAAKDKSRGLKVVKSEAFVGGLSKDVTEDDLMELFKPVAQLEEVRLVKDKNSGLHKGFAFVKFPNSTLRDEACKKLDKTEFKGKTIGVTPSLNNNTLYIGLLTRTWKEEEIEGWLKEKYEGIVKFDLMADPNDRSQNRGFGFLVFDDHATALEAHKSYREHGLEIENAKLSMDWADPKEEPDEATMSKVKVLYISNLDLGATEEILTEAFGKYGEIEKVVLSNKMQYSKRKDFAFVTFTERENALKAIEEMNGKPLEKFPSKNLDVTLAKPQMKRRSEIIRGGRGGGRRGRESFGRGMRGGRGGRSSYGSYNSSYGGRQSNYSSGTWGMQSGYGYQQQQPMFGMYQPQMVQSWGYATAYPTQQYQQYGQNSQGGQSSNQNYYYQRR